MKTISTFFKVVLTISASFALTAAAQPSLGTSALLEGPSAGVDSVVLVMPTPTNTWTVAANDGWLHLSVANQSGTGSTNVLFSYDANPGDTRTGTLTIAGQTLTITQAGATYVAAPGPVTTLVTGLNAPASVAVDAAGNVYIAESGNNAIKKWVVANNSVTTLVASGLSSPKGVAVDGAGNVYIADSGNNAIKKWVVASNTVVTLVASGLNNPLGVAVDGTGNVYIADSGNNAVKKWTATSNTVTTLVSSGLGGLCGVAVDCAGNVYISDSGNNAIKKWAATNNTVTTLVSAGLNSPFGVAVDGAGNVYIADYMNSMIKKWTAADNTVTTVLAWGSAYAKWVAVDGVGNLYISSDYGYGVGELPRAFVDPTAKAEGPSAGSDTLPVVLPATANLIGPFAPTSDQPWLTITGITNGVASFAFGAYTGANRTANVTLLGQPISITQVAGSVITGQPANLTVCAGSPATFAVNAVGNNLAYQWLVSQDGGNTFTNISDTATNASYTNLDATLADNGNQYQVIVTGTVFSATSAPPAVLTVSAPATASAGVNQTIGAGSSTAPLGGSIGGGQTTGLWASSGTGAFTPDTTALNATYTPSVGDTAAGSVTLTLSSSGSGAPCPNATAQVVVTIEAPPAVGSAPTNLTVCAGSPAVFSVGATGGGLTYQWQVSQDGGNTFTNISSTATNASYTNLAPTVADNGNQYQVVVSAGGASVTSAPPAVLTVNVSATAGTGGNQTICPGNATTGLGGTVGGGATGGTWSSPGTGSFTPNATTLNAAYTPSTADIAVGAVTLTLSSTGQVAPCPPATVQLVVTMQRPPAITRLPSNLTIVAGWPAVLSVGATGAGLTYQWRVSRDGGVTFTNISNTATNASYTNAVPTLADNGNEYQVTVSDRCLTSATSSPPALLTVSPAPPPALGATGLLEGPGVGADSLVLAMGAPTSTWTATADAPWLHLSAANQNGTGSTNVVFSYDANPGATRTGTLTIAGQTLTVTQAGATYVATPGPVTTLVASGLNNPYGVAVDGAGNVYFADYGNTAIKKWTATNNTVTTLVGLVGGRTPCGVAVDGAGNVYYSYFFPYYYLGATNYGYGLAKWTAASHTVTTLVGDTSSYLYFLPGGVAVDGVGNVCFVYSTFRTCFYELEKWTAVSNTVTEVVRWGGECPWALAGGVALDGAGNVYIADTLNNAIKEWTAANNSVTTLVASGLSHPNSVAVDGASNVYIADTGHNAIKKWTAANNSVTTLVASGLSNPNGAAVDSAGNVYITDGSNNAVKELPRAFVDPTAKWESTAAGSGTLPVVLPATANLRAPFVPTSDSAWLTITGITNGVVSFAFGANSASTNRTAHITLLGQSISITQAPVTPPILIGPTWLSNGLFQFAFSNNDLGASFTVLTTTNLSLPLSNWTLAGPATNTAPGVFQFSTGTMTNPQGFYRIRCP